MKRNKKNKIVEVPVVQFADNGNGLGYFQHEDGTSRSVQIPFTMPGDTASVTLLRKRNDVYEGRLEKIISPSPERIAPKCVHFGICGGCRFQHITYEKQLELKESYVRNSFSEVLTSDVEFKPIVAVDNQWNYRNKMEFTFSKDTKGVSYLGLIKEGKQRRVLQLNECHLTGSWFIEGLNAVRQWWKQSDLHAYNASQNTGSLRTLTLREGFRTGDRMVILTVSGHCEYALKKDSLDDFVSCMRKSIELEDSEKKLSIFLRIQQVAKGMATNFYEMRLFGSDYIREEIHIQLDPLEEPDRFYFNISPTAFFQPNTLNAETLYALVLQMASISKDSVVYDLYCGTGTLGICSARLAKQVVGIELSPETALDAQSNILINNLKNVVVLTGAVRHVLAQIKSENSFPSPDIIFMDPPRAGLDPEALKNLLALNCPKIIYLSSNPKAQLENIFCLIQNGYRIARIQPVDQFPQTFHAVNIVLLVKE